MNALRTASAIIQLLEGCLRFTAAVSSFLIEKSSGYRNERFGRFWGNVLWSSGIINVDNLQETATNINTWSDREAMAWKGSYLTSLTTVSVAVSSSLLVVNLASAVTDRHRGQYSHPWYVEVMYADRTWSSQDPRLPVSPLVMPCSYQAVAMPTY